MRTGRLVIDNGNTIDIDSTGETTIADGVVHTDQLIGVGAVFHSVDTPAAEPIEVGAIGSKKWQRSTNFPNN